MKKDLNQQILELLKKGLKQKEIAKQLQVSVPTISKRVVEMKEKGILPSKPKVNISNKRIIELRNQGLTIQEIADELNSTKTTIYNRMKALTKNGVIFEKNNKKKNKKPIDELDEQIIELRKQGASQVQMAKTLNVNPITISSRIKKIKEKGIEFVDFYEKIENENKQILSLRQQGLKLSEIAKKLNMSISTISYRIKLMKAKGVDIKKPPRLKDYTDIDAKIEELRKQGLLEREISETLKIQISTISKRINEMKKCGIELEKPQEVEKDNKIIEMRKQGCTINKIAKELNVSEDAVSKRIRKMKTKGLDVTKIGVEKRLKEIDEKILELRKQGLAQWKIGKIIGKSQNYISYRLRRMKEMGINIEPVLSENTKTIVDNASKINGKIDDAKLAKAIAKLVDSKNATESQIKIIAQYYGIDVNSVFKLIKYIDEK